MPTSHSGSLKFRWRKAAPDRVLFANDQLAVRCFEEIDFDYAAVDATSALLTAAT